MILAAPMQGVPCTSGRYLNMPWHCWALVDLVAAHVELSETGHCARAAMQEAGRLFTFLAAGGPAGALAGIWHLQCHCLLV